VATASFLYKTCIKIILTVFKDGILEKFKFPKNRRNPSQFVPIQFSRSISDSVDKTN